MQPSAASGGLRPGPGAASGARARRARGGGRRRCRGRRRSGAPRPPRARRSARARASGIGARESQSSSPAGERLGVGGADRRRRRRADAGGRRAGPAGHRASANEQTAITIALRVPIFANCCGPPARRDAGTPRSARPARSALRFGPVTNSPTGIRRRAARRGQLDLGVGRRTAAAARRRPGRTVPRLPPTVPRLRICGEPTVRDAIARPGQPVAELGDQPACSVTPAPIRRRPSSGPHSRQLRDAREVEDRVRAARGRSSARPSRRCPPRSAPRPGAPALASSASVQVSRLQDVHARAPSSHPHGDRRDTRRARARALRRAGGVQRGARPADAALRHPGAAGGRRPRGGLDAVGRTVGAAGRGRQRDRARAAAPDRPWSSDPTSTPSATPVATTGCSACWWRSPAPSARRGRCRSRRVRRRGGRALRHRLPRQRRRGRALRPGLAGARATPTGSRWPRRCARSAATRGAAVRAPTDVAALRRGAHRAGAGAGGARACRSAVVEGDRRADACAGGVPRRRGARRDGADGRCAATRWSPRRSGSWPWRARPRQGLVATVGEVAVAPGASNVIPGRVELSLDVRHPDDRARAEACRGAARPRRGDRRGPRRATTFAQLQSTPAVTCDAALTASLAAPSSLPVTRNCGW